MFCELFPICILSSIKKGCAASSLHPAISYLGTAVICAFGSVAKRGGFASTPLSSSKECKNLFLEIEEMTGEHDVLHRGVHA